MCKIVKKNGFTSIKTKHLRFLDALRYLAPGFNLRKFIKSFAPDVPLGKLYFPYEYLKSVRQLSEKSLPPYPTFYSKLRGVNVLDEEHCEFQNLISSGVAEDRALVKLGLKARPENGQQIYSFLLQLWQDRKMETLGDFLKVYTLNMIWFRL